MTIVVKIGRRWRAVCDDPGHGEPLLFTPLPQTWVSENSSGPWVLARIDAIGHEFECHRQEVEMPWPVGRS